MKQKINLLVVLGIFLFISGCQDDSPTSSENKQRTVRYYGLVTPVSNGYVSKTFIYTNENGGTSQVSSSNGIFDKTIKISSGQSVMLKSSGSTSKELVISARAIIYVDDEKVAYSDANSTLYYNSVSASAIVP